MRVVFSFLLISLFSFQSYSQVDTWLDARGKAGFLVAHRSIMGHIATEHAFATELSFIKRGKGEKAWHEGYGYPTYGFTGFFGSTGNRELLGHTYGGYTFMSFPLIRYRSYTLSGKMGVGVGYTTKVYNPDDSLLILSIAIGSHLNAMVCLGLESRFEFNDHSITVAADMTHFSNGASKVPNLGLNLPFLSLGYGYRIKKAVVDSVYSHEPFDPYWQLGGVGILSSKEIFPTGGKRYPVYAASLIGRRYFKRNVGMELSFDFISKQAIMGYRTEIPKTQGEIIQLGLFAGYLLPLDHLHFVIGMGYYLKDKFQPEDPMYHRVGLRYIFKSGLNLNVVLKSHWARADYIEYGIGYTFNR